jgi:CubicO group peptidase (beta-lactamase class C family)
MKNVTRAFLVLVLLSAARIATAQGTLTADLGAKVESAVRDVMARTGAPSASVGIVLDGRIVYTKAFGKARLDPPVDATADM